MTKICTHTGDDGNTALYRGKRVSKNHPRIKAIGVIDEVNSSIGVVVSFTENKELVNFLHQIQSELLVIGAVLAGKDQNVSLLDTKTQVLEHEIDWMSKGTMTLNAFVIPGGVSASSFAHFTRSIVRRAERVIIELSQEEPVDKRITTYLNRLSDYFYILARYLNHEAGMKDTVWETSLKSKPGPSQEAGQISRKE